MIGQLVAVFWLVPGSPGRITVVCEGEGPHPQPLEGPQHPQAGPDAVAALHRDEARYLPALVRVDNLCRKRDIEEETYKYIYKHIQSFIVNFN